MASNEDEDDEGNSLREMFNNFGLSQIADTYVFNGDEDEIVPKTIALMAGLLQIAMTHTYAVYDRSAMRNEVKLLTDKFRKSQRKATDKEPEARELVDVVCKSFEASARYFQAEGHRIAGEDCKGVAMFDVAGVADCVVAPIVCGFDTQKLKELTDDNIPDGILDVAVKAMSKAYIIDASEELENTFRFHAREKVKHVARRFYNRRTKET